MIQRITDWYNGYTLEDKLELEWLLYTAKELAIDELNIDLKNNKDKDLLNGDYTMEVSMVVVNRNVSFFKPLAGKKDIVRQLLLLSVDGATIRTRIDLDTIGGNKFQFSIEYNVDDLLNKQK